MSMFRNEQLRSPLAEFNPGNHGTTSIYYGENDAASPEIETVLKTGWGIRPTSVDSITFSGRRHSDVVRVRTDSTLYILKNSHLRDPRQLAFTLGCLRHCRDFGVRVPHVVEPTTTDWYSQTSGRHFALMKFVAGEHFDGSRYELAQASIEQAYFHRALRAYPDPGVDAMRSEHYSETHHPDRLRDLAQLVATRPSTSLFEKLAAQASDELLEWSKAVAEADLLTLPRQLIHRDLHPHNLLYHEVSRELTALLDFEALCVAQRARNVAFAMHRLSRTYGPLTERQSDVGVDIVDRAKRYLDEYIKRNSLTDREIAAIPHLIADEALQRVMLHLILHYEKGETRSDFDLQKQLETLRESALFSKL